MKMGMRVGGLVLAVVVGMLVAGCGGSDGADSPEDAVNTFFEATVDKDAEALCGVITEESGTQAAEQEDADTCEEGVEKSFASDDIDDTISQIEGAEVGEATIDGDTATVAVTSSEGDEGEVTVVKDGDVWKVDASS